ncbi:MAG: hypothetical protein ACRDI2_08825 [Chloroflexota bacterium]
MVMTEQDSRLAARIKLVEEHVDAENDHDLDRLMATFGAAPTYALNTEHFLGQDGVRS